MIGFLVQETQEQHEELVEFCRKFKFERMGAFAYSAEEGTPAAVLPEQVRLPTGAQLLRQRIWNTAPRGSASHVG